MGPRFPFIANYRFGIGCVLLAGLFTSVAGILVRLIEAADGWEILFYRCLFSSLVLLGFIAFTHRARTVSAFRSIGHPGVLATFFLASAFCCFIFALLHTTVANVVFILSASPFFAALFGWIVLREPVGRGLWAAMAFAGLGIGLLVGDGVVAGSLVGNALALVSCLCYSATLVAFRKAKRVDMLPAPCLAGLLAAAVASLFVERYWIGLNDFALAAALGVVTLGFQYILVTLAARSVPAAEIALVSRIQVVLAPLWVWVAVGEVPTAISLAGGTVVVAAVLAPAIIALRMRR